MVSDIRFVLYYAPFSDPTDNTSHKGDCGDSFCGEIDGADRRMEGTTDQGAFFSLEVVRLDTTYDGSDNGPVRSLEKVCRR